MEVTRTFDLLERYKELYSFKDDALACKLNGEWIKYSSLDYINYCNYLSYGLLALGLKKGDKIITIGLRKIILSFGINTCLKAIHLHP